MSPRTLNDLVTSRRGESAPFAYFSNESPLTVGELAVRADRLVGSLARANVGLGTRVILVAPNGSLSISALLACWRLGAMVCPADIFLSGGAFATLIEMFRPQLVLADPRVGNAAEYLDAAAARGCPTLELGPALESVNAGVVAPAPGPRDGAICIFTSGSTGNPKGVVLTHASLLEGVRNLVAAKALTSADRGFCVLPFSHVNGLVTTLLSPLASGGTILYWQRPFDAQEVLALIDEKNCTWFSGVPTHYAQFMSPPVEKGAWSLKAMRFFRSAAAPLPAKLIGEFESHYGIPLLETMGMTEASGQIFANPLPPAARKVGSVGIPVGLEARIVADDGHVCGENEPGEIQLRGPAMMTGYLDSPDETAKAFDGDWLKSGDLGVRDGDGYYFITGRKKDIAIFSGVNVSLRALERALEPLPNVRAVACVGQAHDSFGETIVAYVVPKVPEGEYQTLVDAVSAELYPVLPSRQALHGVRLVANVPRSGAGKILKGKLPAEAILFEGRRQLPSKPRELLAEVLGISVAQITDDLQRGSIPKWDSLAHVALLVGVEAVLRKRLTRAEMGALRSYRGLEKVLRGEAVHAPAKVTGAQRANMQGLLAMLADAGYGASPVNYLILTDEACRKQGIEESEALVDALLEALPSGQTLVMNAFTWDFCRKKVYHYENTPCETGYLVEAFRRTPGVRRANHPIYSYAAIGPGSGSLLNHEGATSWGPGSTTHKLLYADGVRAIHLGVPFLYRNPGIHAVEEAVAVPYRYFKTFEGVADFGAGAKPYATQMYVRQLQPEANNDWTPLCEQMETDRLVYRRKEACLFAYDNCDLARMSAEILARDPFAFLGNCAYREQLL